MSLSLFSNRWSLLSDDKETDRDDQTCPAEDDLDKLAESRRCELINQ